MGAEGQRFTICQQSKSLRIFIYIYCHVQVTIIVDDAPDSPPIFTQKVYEGEINENTAFGNGVRLLGSRGGLKISASDPDLNSSVSDN